MQLLCDYKHSYTQHGGLRPFGVSFLYAGWDRHHGFQLYQSDPSGNYRCGPPQCAHVATRARARTRAQAHTRSPDLPQPPFSLHSGWKATSIGSNSESAKATLKAEYKADFSLTAAAELALKTLTKAMDTTAPSSEKVEVAVLTRDGAGALVQKQYSAAEVDALLAVIKAAAPAAAAVAVT